MVEMLGVLAIIGVLSVGGIAGYTKAMMQHKINKTTEQISHIVGNMRTLFSSQRNYGSFICYSGSGTECNVLKKAHVFPDEMWNADGTAVENAFGGTINIQSTTRKMGTSDSKGFSIQLNGLPEEACMALSTYNWGSGSASGLVALAINNGSGGFAESNEHLQGYTSSNYAIAVPGGSTVSVPVPANVAAEACGSDDSNTFTLNFY